MLLTIFMLFLKDCNSLIADSLQSQCRLNAEMPTNHGSFPNSGVTIPLIIGDGIVISFVC